MSAEEATTYRVEGMSCGHCETAVRHELEKVSGIEGVEVDLDSKQVVVRGDFDDRAARAAIEDAGYEAAAA